jgi:hypothetical protein
MVDAGASRQRLRSLAGACKEQGVERVLLDLRDLRFGPDPVFTPADLASMVDTFHEMGFERRHRLAVLYKADPHHGARMFAFISRERGWNVKAFESYEEALTWLALSEEALGSSGDSGTPDGEREGGRRDA